MLKKEMDQYLAAIKADYRKWNASRNLTPEQQKIADEMAAEFDANLRIDEGTKYLKVVSKGSVHSFVVIKADSKFKNGDILNIDITVIKDGFHGDTSRMFTVGEPSIAAKRLCEVTREAMWAGISQVAPGKRLGDIGAAIQRLAEGAGYSVVREFCGHGIGRGFHEEPQVLHYGKPGTGLELKAGMTFTIEPMINAGRPEIRELADGWTIVTKDHSLSAQWEHTVLVTETGVEVLTVSEASPDRDRAAPALTASAG